MNLQDFLIKISFNVAERQFEFRKFLCGLLKLKKHLCHLSDN
jgi:hypothetical protein